MEVTSLRRTNEREMVAMTTFVQNRAGAGAGAGDVGKRARAMKSAAATAFVRSPSWAEFKFQGGRS